MNNLKPECPYLESRNVGSDRDLMMPPKEALCLHLLSCKIRSSLILKLLLFAAKSVQQVRHEASLLRAKCHSMAESFSGMLHCDLCTLATDQTAGPDTLMLLQHSCHPGKAYRSALFLCSRVSRKVFFCKFI